MLRRDFLKLSALSGGLAGIARPIDTLVPDSLKEQFLREAEIRHAWPIGQGITGSLRVRLSDGQFTHDAHVQRVDEFRTLAGDVAQFRDSFRHNVAAYRIDRLLRMNMVPVTVEREFEGRPAAFSWWVDGLLMSEAERVDKGVKPYEIRSWNKQMYVVRVFDQLIANPDRNLSNLLISEDWHIWMIDHTRAFRVQRQLPEEGSIRACDRLLFEELKDLSSLMLEGCVKDLLTPEQVQAILARRDRIVTVLEAAVSQKGAKSVLYSYLPRD